MLLLHIHGGHVNCLIYHRRYITLASRPFIDRTSSNRLQSKRRAKCHCSLYFRLEQTQQESYAKRKFYRRRLDADPATIE